MAYMKTHFIKFVIFAISLFSACIILTYLISISIEKEKEKARSLLGKDVILNKDTLTIIDYNLVLNTYTLSNNQEIGIELGKRILINK